MMAVVSISLFFIYIFCLWSLYQGVTRAQKLVCLLRKTILINSQVSEHYFMDFLEKGECFGLTHSLGCVYPTLYIIRLLGRVYHFSLLICYPCPVRYMHVEKKSQGDYNTWEKFPWQYLARANYTYSML